ncbi:inositol monophosphatase family protein [Hazenella sp. IB182353]|uniref:inositol monophosphatase family protein n=1 Tax=Polycladospora coralii TaxID=2771432 RepID=UPI0017473270|nr:inositol monophosphatase family protein [Polycladospora coralii]MBS7531398.1 inositol monophosphatase family protein [Polycladospora coralii]
MKNQAFLIYEHTHEWVIEAGQKVRHFLRHKTMHFETKTDEHDLVTEMDRTIEQFFVEKIKSHYPDHQIIGEEGMSHPPQSLDGWVWLIDPIDGTSNFVSFQEDFVISVALYHKQIGVFGYVYDVMSGKMYHAFRDKGLFINHEPVPPLSEQKRLTDAMIALDLHMPEEERQTNMEKIMHLTEQVRGIRIYGATALTLAKCAVGKLDAYLTFSTFPWDHAAGRILVEEAGGIVSDFNANALSLQTPTSVVACNRNIYSDLLGLLTHK